MTMAPRLPAIVEKGNAGGYTWVRNHHRGLDGFLQRVEVWDHPIGEWDAGYALRTMADYQLARDIFNTHGTVYPFRFFAPALDHHNAVGAALGTGNGSNTDFSFVKKWTAGARTYTKNIFALVNDTATVKVNGSAISGASWTLIKPPVVGGVHFPVVARITTPPPNGHAVTADFDFDTPVVYTNNRLIQASETYSQGRLRGITVAEVLENPDL